MAVIAEGEAGIEQPTLKVISAFMFSTPLIQKGDELLNIEGKMHKALT